MDFAEISHQIEIRGSLDKILGRTMYARKAKRV
jgi:hypothetical protein